PPQTINSLYACVQSTHIIAVLGVNERVRLVLGQLWCCGIRTKMVEHQGRWPLSSHPSSLEFPRARRFLPCRVLPPLDRSASRCYPPGGAAAEHRSHIDRPLGTLPRLPAALASRP